MTSTAPVQNFLLGGNVTSQAAPISNSGTGSLGAPLLAGSAQVLEKDKSCCPANYEPGHCHGFEMHKGSGWIFAHGDFNIKDCGAQQGDIELRKRKSDIRMLAISAGVMVLVMALEVSCGFAFDSLALLSDGMHYASDVALYSWLLMAVMLSERKEELAGYSFGYHRAQVLGALVALLLQYFATGLLIFSAVQRLTLHPRRVYGPAICAVGFASLMANLALLHLMPASTGGHGHSHGGGGTDAAGVARLHMLGDLVQGSAVICTGLIAWVWPGCTWADPSSTFVYACVVLGSSWRVFQDLMATLMERAPLELDVKGLFDDMAKLKGVIDIHCCHVWALAPGKVAMSAHLHIDDDKHEEVLHAAQILVKHKYGIAHSTLQISEDEDLA